MHSNQVFDKLEKKELLTIIAYTALNGVKQRKKNRFIQRLQQ